MSKSKNSLCFPLRKRKREVSVFLRISINDKVFEICQQSDKLLLAIFNYLERRIISIAICSITSSFFILSSMLNTINAFPPNFFVKSSKLALILSVAE